VYKSLVAADAKAGRTSATSVVFFFRTFYERLFEVAPSVRPLFKSDMSVQGRALVKVCVF
jgi:sulfur relay (sulfurtransferase) DsrC/TusE family protein